MEHIIIGIIISSMQLQEEQYPLTDLPAYGAGTIEITISLIQVLQLSVVCVVGKSWCGAVGGKGLIGRICWDCDYSRKEKNDFGDYQLIQRSYSKRAKFSMAILNEQIDSVQELL